MCPCDDGIEDTEHFLLLCPSFQESRREFLADDSSKPLGYTDLSIAALLQILLHGDKDFPDDLNKNILLSTVRFIQRTGRFD